MCTTNKRRDRIKQKTTTTQREMKNMENLFETKQQLILKLKDAEDRLTNQKNILKNKENDLWLNTEFKALGYTNDDTRRAYVNHEISDLKLAEELIRNEITMLKRELNLCDDKIKLFTI